MNIVLISHEIPYLPIHGNRLNTWNWILALKKLGHNVYLITWCEIIKNDLPSQQEIDYLTTIVNEFTLFSIPRSFKRLIRLISLPSLSAARVLDKNKMIKIIQKTQKFNADFIVLDSIFCAEVGFELSKHFNIPIGVRLNNLEHIYYKGQFKLAKNIRNKLSLLACQLHLKKYEENVIKKANYFVDVSKKDIEYWYSRGYHHGHWVPPVFLENTSSEIITDKQFDITYTGNLNAPNNVEGINWFIKQVLPIIKIKLPNVKVALIGASPSNALKNIVKNMSHDVTIVANPKNIEQYYTTSTVLINPILFGSGVNVKSIQMLFTKSQVVTTSVGIKGLPNKFSEVFFVTDNAEDFAEITVDIIQKKLQKSIDGREEIKAIFDERALMEFTNTMMQIKQKEFSS